MKRIQSTESHKQSIAEMIEELKKSSRPMDGEEQKKESQIEFMLKQKNTEIKSKSVSILVGFIVCNFIYRIHL